MSESETNAGDERAPESQHADYQHLDLEHARKAIPGGEKGLLNLAGICADECRSLMPQLEDAVAASDAALIRRLAHTVKGATKYFGATAVGETALALEIEGRDSLLKEAPSTFAKLKPLVEQLIAELEELLKLE